MKTSSPWNPTWLAHHIVCMIKPVLAMQPVPQVVKNMARSDVTCVVALIPQYCLITSNTGIATRNKCIATSSFLLLAIPFVTSRCVKCRLCCWSPSAASRSWRSWSKTRFCSSSTYRKGKAGQSKSSQDLRWRGVLVELKHIIGNRF